MIRTILKFSWLWLYLWFIDVIFKTEGHFSRNCKQPNTQVQSWMSKHLVYFHHTYENICKHWFRAIRINYSYLENRDAPYVQHWSNWGRSTIVCYWRQMLLVINESLKFGYFQLFLYFKKKELSFHHYRNMTPLALRTSQIVRNCTDVTYKFCTVMKFWWETELQSGKTTQQHKIE